MAMPFRDFMCSESSLEVSFFSNGLVAFDDDLDFAFGHGLFSGSFFSSGFLGSFLYGSVFGDFLYGFALTFALAAGAGSE